MKLAVVIGKVVADRKEGNLVGHPILVVSYLDADLNDTKKTAAVIDTTGAGAGEVVMLCGSSSARLASNMKNVATDNTIIGIVDSISMGKKDVYKKE